MKKLLLIVGALLLSGCTLPSLNTSACDTSGDYAESTQETWSTDTFSVTYSRPHCWAVNTSPTQLMITDYDSENYVELSIFALSSVEGGVTPSTKALATGETLYIYTSAPEDHEVQIILDSLDVSYPNSGAAHLSSACDAPDSTYAYSTQQTWKTLTYDLIFCWSAEELTSPEGQTSLLLKKGDGSAWVKITLMSGIPYTEKPTPLVTQNEDGTTTYVYEGHFTAVTNAPDNSNVQDILYSLNRANLTDEAPTP